jgi:antirestriction protein ArdC
MLRQAWAFAQAQIETVRQYQAAVVTAEALIWHHGYKGLDAALKAAEAPTGDAREDIRAELVARIAADRYLRLKEASLIERAALLQAWSQRNGQMIST